MDKGNKISGSGALTAVVCFFLPWVLVSCGSNQVRNFTGWELAAGTTINNGWTVQSVSGTPELFFVLAAGLAVLTLIYFSWKNQQVYKYQGVGLVILGIIPLGIIFWQFNSLQNEVASQSLSTIQVNYQLGFWGVILGYISVIIGGTLIIREFSQITGLKPEAVLSDIRLQLDTVQSVVSGSNHQPQVDEQPHNMQQSVPSKKVTDNLIDRTPEDQTQQIATSQNTLSSSNSQDSSNSELPFRKIDFE